MSSASDCVDSNDLHGRNAGPITFQVDHPHSGVFIRFISMDKPINQSAGIILSTVAEGEEKEDTSNFHSRHSRLRIVQDDESGIAARVTMETGSRSDTFTLHPTSTAEVTWGIIQSDCRVINTDLAFERRAIIDSGRWFEIGIFKGVEKLAEGKGKIRLLDVRC